MFAKRSAENYDDPLPGIKRKTLVFGEKTLMTEFVLAARSVLPKHSHPHEQTGYLVKGSLRFFGDEGETIVTPGCSWSFKGGVIHGAYALEGSVAIEVFSPVRQEYLE
jgi:quercetin dioxygenase-like cupin family protein